MTTSSFTAYEATQNYNWVTRYLHSGRYKELHKVVGKLQSELEGRPVRVLDIGCGPGSAVGPLIEKFNVDYTGIDYDPTFIGAARHKYGDRPNCRFVTADASDPSHYTPMSSDVVIALETFEHIPANRVVQIIEHVCEIVRPRVFMVTVPVEVGPAVWIKNWGSALMGYDRKSGDFGETFWAGLYQLDRVPAHLVSHQGFDWRWLAHTMRLNAPIKEIRSLPFRFIPKAFAPTMLMISEPAKKFRTTAQSGPDAWKVNHGSEETELS